MKAVQHNIVYVLGFCVAALCLTCLVKAQSSDQNFPTPVTTNEINGVIKARDIGDSRLTTYFYAFDGGQGDIFINLVTKNLSGDIDIFAAEGLRPLAKMVVYADADANETGRLIYLRKPERLLLRVEGRPPGDDPATFRIKFAGSFVALKPTKAVEDVRPVSTSKKDETAVRVNSVGTIIDVKPKQAPLKNVEPDKAKSAETPPKDLPKDVKANEAKAKEGGANTVKKPVVVVSDVPIPTAKTEPIKKPIEPAPKTAATRPVKPKITDTSAKPNKKPVEPPAKKEEKKPDPLADIRLIIQLKDGGVIERRLSEIVKFSVDNGVLTVVAKDGKITRYSMLLVAKVTIE